MDVYFNFLGYYPGADNILFYQGVRKKGAQMKGRAFFYLAAIFLTMNLLGCVPLMIGSAVGVVGGRVVSKDTIQGETDKPYDTLWNSAVMVSKIRGTIKYEDSLKGIIDLEAESSLVNIRLVRLTAATTRIKVKARKYHFPNLDLAQDIFIKIMTETK